MNYDKEKRIEILKTMDNIARKLCDEELFYDYWLAEGIPDCATQEDLECIAKDSELYRDIEKTFENIIKYGDFENLTEEEILFMIAYTILK